MKRRGLFAALFLSITLLAGCTSQSAPAPQASDSTTQEASVAQETSGEQEDASSAEGSTIALGRVATDMYGNEIAMPLEVDTIISLAPSTTELLIDLGLSEKIIAVDTYSQMDYADLLPAGIPAFDMMAPDNEQIVALNADIVFTTGMSYAWGEDVFASAREAGVFIIDIESPSTLQEIVDSIIFIGDCALARKEAEAIAQEMEAFLGEVHTIMDTTDLAERRSVLFELYTPTADYPTIYSAGPGSYIDEIIALCGGDNIAATQDSPWPALDEEFCVSADPDIILSADNYTPDAVNSHLALEGWAHVKAIENGEVYLIDANRINRPNHRVCAAILEIGQLLYPELFMDLEDPFEEALLEAA